MADHGEPIKIGFEFSACVTFTLGTSEARSAWRKLEAAHDDGIDIESDDAVNFVRKHLGHHIGDIMYNLDGLPDSVEVIVRPDGLYVRDQSD